MAGEAFTTLIPGVLTVCTYVGFAPFAHELEGRIVGTDIELLERFAARYALRLSCLKKPFPHLWLTPGAGECDVAASGLGARADRELGARAVWSRPYMTVQRSLLIRRGEAERLQVPEDFAGKTIVATPESAADFDARERYVPHGATLIAEVPSQDDVARRLLNHEVDAFGEGDVSNAYLAEQYLDREGQPLLVLADVHPLEPIETLHFAVRAADPRLTQCLDAFIAASIEDA